MCHKKKTLSRHSNTRTTPLSPLAREAIRNVTKMMNDLKEMLEAKSDPVDPIEEFEDDKPEDKTTDTKVKESEEDLDKAMGMFTQAEADLMALSVTRPQFPEIPELPRRSCTRYNCCCDTKPVCKTYPEPEGWTSGDSSPITISLSSLYPKECPGAPKKTKPVIEERDRVDIDIYNEKLNKTSVVAAMFREWINHHGGLPSFSDRKLALEWCEFVRSEVYCNYPKDSTGEKRADLGLREGQIFYRETEDYSNGVLYPWVYNWRAPTKAEKAGMKYNYIEDPTLEDYHDTKSYHFLGPGHMLLNLRDRHGKIIRKCSKDKCSMCRKEMKTQFTK